MSSKRNSKIRAGTVAGKIKTNMAASMTAEDQRAALNKLTFGEGWAKWEAEIEHRIRDFADDEPIKQSTRRGLALVKEMMFEKL
jgi:hypothetical protein